MSIQETIRKEIEIAFSKYAQPLWFRIIKYLLLGIFIYFFWGSKIIWAILFVTSMLSLAVHFWFRHKTNRWTKSYWLWDVNKTKRRKNNGN